MRWGDLDLDRAEMRLPAETQKGRRDAIVPLPTSLVARLRDHREQERAAGAGDAGDPVFRNAHGQPLGTALQGMWRRCLKRAGIAQADDRGRRVDIHALRHTYGTMMAGRTDPRTLQRLMRHSDVTTTLRYYVHDDDERARGAVEGL